MNITSLTNKTRRTAQVFTGTVAYDTIAAGNSEIKSVQLTHLDRGSTYYCMASFCELTNTTCFSPFNGLYKGSTPFGTLSTAYGTQARPWFIFKTIYGHRNTFEWSAVPTFNKTNNYYSMDIHFTANRWSKIYYIVAPAQPWVDTSYTRSLYSRVTAKTQLPKTRWTSYREESLYTATWGADLWNTATGRAQGSITDTTIFDNSGNLGFQPMLHGDDLNFAGMSPQRRRV